MPCKAPVPCHTFCFTLEEIAPDYVLSDLCELPEAEYRVLTTHTPAGPGGKNDRLAIITGHGTGGGFCEIHPVHGHRLAGCLELFPGGFRELFTVKIPARWGRVILVFSLLYMQAKRALMKKSLLLYI